MKLTLKNYNTTLSAELLLKAKKGLVRECDEIEKGHYQAYVDENDNTFDVFLLINSKGEVIDQGCDCQSSSKFCHHVAALLIFVSKGKKVVTKLRGGRKGNNIGELVHEADPEKLKTWLIELLTTNKELGMTFSYQFSQKVLQPEDLKQLTLDAVKAVIKNKRSVDNIQAKKITDLWTTLHDPVLADWYSQPAAEIAFLSVHAIMEACDQVQEKYGTFNGRIPKYQEKMMIKALESLHQIKDEGIWDLVTARISDRIHGGPYHVRTYYLNFLSQLHHLSTLERKLRLAKGLVAQFMKVDAAHFYDADKYIITIFDLVANSGLFEEYYILFHPLQYKNDYNLELISLLMEHEMYALAEKYCLEQVAGNTNGSYNYPYLDILAEIYTIKKEDKKLAGVLKAGLSYTYDFNTYLFVESQMEDGEEKSKWRNQFMAAARREAGYNDRAMWFSFKLLDHEQKHAKMFDYLESTFNYELCAKYGRKLSMQNKEKFLKLLLYRMDAIGKLTEQEATRLQPILEEILQICFMHYTGDELKMMLLERLKRQKYIIPNYFVAYLSEKLEFDENRFRSHN